MKPTYEQLEIRCEMYRAIAELNAQTVQAQQRVYNDHINKLENRTDDLLRELHIIRQRANKKRTT